MGSLYLKDMAKWFRDAGLKVVECSGWQNRSRSTGGYESGRPWCVMWHHTASSSSASAKQDTDYMIYSSDARPTANIYIARNGEVWLMAAGATNTNGQGRSRSFSKGTVPSDCMNTYAVGIEIGNNGVGEAYSKATIDAAFKVSTVLCSKLGLKPTDVDTHQDYAPDRKVDPSTCNAIQGGWKPSSVTSSGTWSVADLRSECSRRSGATPAPTPTPTPEEDIDMAWRVAKHQDTGAYYIGDGKTAYWVSDSGGDINTIEAAIRMAPGAVNVKALTGADSNLKPMVTTWGDVGLVNNGNIKKYVGANKHLA
jgi:N-acetylmuramoyl-L-alanine amidase